MGFPEFWPQAFNRFPKLHEAVSDLTSLVNGVIRSRARGRLQIILGFMTGSVSNSFGAVTTLALNGYGYDAVRISRGMFEIAVNAAYLQRHPDLVDDFLDYHWVDQRQRLDYLKCYRPTEFEGLPKDVIVEAATEYERVIPRFAGKNGRPRGSWSAKSIRARAEEVGLGELYLTFYAYASGIHHCDFAGLASQAVKGRVQIDIAPSFAAIKDALIMGYQCVLSVVGSANKVASLGLDDRLNAAIAAFGTYTQTWSAEARDA